MAKDVFQHFATYGQTAAEAPNHAGPVPRDFTFNSLVGCCMDKFHRVWVCDTGNDRVLILDQDLNTILYVLNFPEEGKVGKQAKQANLHFRMPFQLASHPEKNQIYISDMGNSRVVVMHYSAKQVSFSHVFGTQQQNGGMPLQDPNGVTVVKHDDDKYYVHVNDEFFHLPSDKLRNRCVCYTEEGEYVDEFRTVVDPKGKAHDLYWPQSLSSDKEGNLYIANTGSYEILKCSASAKVDANYRIHGKKPIVMHTFAQPRGVGMMNIMRFVAAIGEHVFVPDHILNTISVYSLDGKLQTTLFSIAPSVNRKNNPVRSPTDPLYYSMEDSMLLNPYLICQGEKEDIYFVTEPFTSRLMKLHIPRLKGPSPTMHLLKGLGARRDQPGGKHIDPQFNCATAVTSFTPPKKLPLPAQAQTEDLPWWLKWNPYQQWYMAWSALATMQYQAFAGNYCDKLLAKNMAGSENALLNMDAGNWRTRAYLPEGKDFDAVKGNPVSGYFLPGNLSMAVYHPKQALLGQICPGTPLLFVANFDYATISMYQLSPSGKLINYGLPFGCYGELDGCMRGPQGMCVDDNGEIFIVDSLNQRIGKWQILQTGQVVFIKNFVWNVKQDLLKPFTPSDVALDAKHRLFVTDQFNNRICVFDLDGKPLWDFGKEGYWQEGQPDGGRFMLPTSLAIDGELLILNDLVNRALKLFRIEKDSLHFLGGISLFKLTVKEGGVWMPYFMYARDGKVHIADSTYNVVQVYRYQ